jgi:transcription antitermination factor NusG
MNDNWFAISIRPRCENSVMKCLSAKGYCVFLPSYHKRQAYSDRVRVLEVPLFPGYLFCRFNPAVRTAWVVTTPGILKILSDGSKPIPVDVAEIDAIQRIVASRQASGPWPYLCVGTRVQIRAGPLLGLKGIVVNLKSESRLIVSVSLLQRSIAVQVDPGWVDVLSDVPIEQEPRQSDVSRG